MNFNNPYELAQYVTPSPLNFVPRKAILPQNLKFLNDMLTEGCCFVEKNEDKVTMI